MDIMLELEGDKLLLTDEEIIAWSDKRFGPKNLFNVNTARDVAKLQLDKIISIEEAKLEKEVIEYLGRKRLPGEER